MSAYDGDVHCPYMDAACGHSICRQCVDATSAARQSSSPRCPFCRVERPNFVQNRSLRDAALAANGGADAGNGGGDLAAGTALPPILPIERPSVDWNALATALTDSARYPLWRCNNVPVPATLGLPPGSRYEDAARYLVENRSPVLPAHVSRSRALCLAVRGVGAADRVDAAASAMQPGVPPTRANVLRVALLSDRRNAAAYNLLGLLWAPSAEPFVIPGTLVGDGRDAEPIRLASIEDCFAHCIVAAGETRSAIGEYGVANLVAHLARTNPTGSVPLPGPSGRAVTVDGLTAPASLRPLASFMTVDQAKQSVSVEDLWACLRGAVSVSTIVTRGFRGMLRWDLPGAVRALAPPSPTAGDSNDANPGDCATTATDIAALLVMVAGVQRNQQYRSLGLQVLASCFGAGRMNLPGTTIAVTPTEMVLAAIDVAPDLPHGYNLLGVFSALRVSGGQSTAGDGDDHLLFVLRDGRSFTLAGLFDEAVAMDGLVANKWGIGRFARANKARHAAS